MMAQAHVVLAAPVLFGHEIGINLPAFLIALAVTTVLAIGIQESAKFNTGIVALKVAVVLLVLGLGSHYVASGQLGHLVAQPLRPSGSPASARARHISSSRTSDSTPFSTTAQEAKNPQRDPYRHHPLAHHLHRAVHRSRRRAHRNGALAAGQHRGPIARAFFDRGLPWASDIITMGALAGLTSVMLVMLLGQTASSTPWPTMAFCPESPSPKSIPGSALPSKNTFLVGTLAGNRRRAHPHRRYRQDGQHRHPAAFVIVWHLHPRPCAPIPPRRAFRTPWVPVVPILGVLFNGYMMVKLGWVNWTRLIVWLIIGLIVYFTYGQKHSRVQRSLLPKIRQPSPPQLPESGMD